MAGRRKKSRTHVVAEDALGNEAPFTEQVNGKRVPKSFVVRLGAVDHQNVGALVQDVRRVMEPYTATKLKERRENKLKDYVNIAGPLGVSHLLAFSQTEEFVNFRLSTLPQGPTLYYQVTGYSLVKDVVNASKRPHSPGTEFRVAPLVVMHNFDECKEERVAVDLQRTAWQHAFPKIVPSQVKLSNVRRVVMLNRIVGEEKDESIELRHYLIVVNAASKRERILERAVKQQVDLSAFNNVDEYVDKCLQEAESSANESDRDDTTKVTLAHDFLGANNRKNQQRRIRLMELGPRMNLKLIKIVDGIQHNEGKVLWHASQ